MGDFPSFYKYPDFSRTCRTLLLEPYDVKFDVVLQVTGVSASQDEESGRGLEITSDRMGASGVLRSESIRVPLLNLGYCHKVSDLDPEVSRSGAATHTKLLRWIPKLEQFFRLTFVSSSISDREPSYGRH